LLRELSIIFVNWNSTDYLRDCIASIYEHTRGISFEIVVVDNASPSGDAEVLARQFPEITLIKSSQNLGFAGANNLGYRRSSGECLLFLNPDTKLMSTALPVMLRRLQSLPDAGMVGCKLLNSDLSVQTSCIQTFPTILNQLLDADYLRARWPNSGLWGVGPLFSDSPEPARVEVISGACLMVKREAFEKAGLFSEDYFMYAEDLDLCYKVAGCGYANYYVGEATVMHHGGKSSTPIPATIMKWKAIPRFCDKHYGRFYGLVFRMAITLAAVARLIAIKTASLFGGVFGNQQSLRSASEKWSAIFGTVLRGCFPGASMPQQKTT
jgi:N-acetylglucosaminyl-diphospho-decaprenol L-rhamnosyltransferase